MNVLVSVVDDNVVPAKNDGSDVITSNSVLEHVRTIIVLFRLKLDLYLQSTVDL